MTLASTALAGVGKGDGTLAAITFEVVAIKASTVTLSDVTLVNPAGERSYPHVENGQVIEPPQVFGDVNRDGVVNIQDLVLVGANFKQTGAHSADVNGDGVIDIVDLVLVVGAIRNAATAPAVHFHALGAYGTGNPSPTAADVQGWLTQAYGLDRTDAPFQRGMDLLIPFLKIYIALAVLMKYQTPVIPATGVRLMTLSLKVAT